MGLVHTMDHVIFAQPGIKRPEDLRGKKVACPALEETYRQYALKLTPARWKSRA